MPVGICGHGIEIEPNLEAELSQDADQLLAQAGQADSELSIALTNDPGIQALNGSYREKDQATDVLSFHQDHPGLLGDLVISLDTARSQARAREHSLRAELRILMVHGLLHLLGYDHERSPEAHLEMAQEEARLMSLLGWEGQGLIALAE